MPLRLTSQRCFPLALLMVAACSSERAGALATSGETSSMATSAPASAAPSAPSASAAGPSAIASAAQPPAKLADLLVRDQPTCHGLQRWNGALVVRTLSPRALDLGAGTSAPLLVGDAERVLALATWKGVPIALSVKSDERYLAVKEGASFKRVEVPAAVRSEPTTSKLVASPLLAADDKLIALVVADKLHLFDGTKWSELTITGVDKSPATLGLLASEVALHDGSLYLAFDRGEWGGALYAVELKTGKAAKQPGPELPVRELTVDAGGDLWAVRGLAHLSLLEGDLRLLHHGKWRTLASTEPGGPSVGWDVLEQISLDAVAFEPTGRPVLLSGKRGVLRKGPGKSWVPAILDWSDFVYVDDLELEGTRAVISTYDAGVLVVDLSSGQRQRITLK